MGSCDSSPLDRDPVREVPIVPSGQDPLSLTVTIDLAEHVAACCVNFDVSFSSRNLREPAIVFVTAFIFAVVSSFPLQDLNCHSKLKISTPRPAS